MTARRLANLLLLGSSLGLGLLPSLTTPGCAAPSQSQSAGHNVSHATFIHCGTLIDEESEQPRENALIEIEEDRIRRVTGFSPTFAKPAGAAFIDLSSETCLPGLIDAHTHVLLQGDVTSQEYADQILGQSIPYRTIQAVAAARIALEHGFTGLRDLETEGAM
ncbi:MAG TPA: hypothetical protein VJV74_06240, partial [Terriglobia bacterium]|nr:hypothetical protein [Terriglobia bacterium]